MSVVYRIESPANYPGPKEYKKGESTQGGIYTESIMRRPLPYRMRQITPSSRDVHPGFVVDGKINLGNAGIYLEPVIDEDKLRAVLAELVKSAEAVDPSSFQRLYIPHGHMRREGGLKLLLPSGDREYTVRLHAPLPQINVHMSKPNPWS